MEETFHKRAEVAAGALLLIIGLGFLVFVLVSLSRDLPIWVLGRRVEAEAVDLWVERTGEIGDEDSKEIYFEYFIRYQFTTPSGETFTKVARISVNEWANLGEGGQVPVIYLPLWPANSRLDDRQFIPFFMGCYIPIVVLIWICLTAGWNLVRPAVVKLKK